MMKPTLDRLRSRGITPSSFLFLGAQQLLRLGMRQWGYRWELRRSGEFKLGLWRRCGKSAKSRKPHLKRFVLIPGFGDSPLSWVGVLLMLEPVLRREFDEVILLDFPGFCGGLYRERACASMDQLIVSVGNVLDSLKPHTVVGHSLGGWLTAAFAASRGKNTRGYSGPEQILLFDPSGAFGTEELKAGFIARFRGIREAGMASIRPHLFAKEPYWFQFVLGRFEKFIESRDTHAFMDSFRDEHLLEPELANVRARVWLIWGDQDTLIPAACARGWMRNLTGTPEAPRTILLKGVGHSPQVERTAVTAAVIGKILRGTMDSRERRWWRVEIGKTEYGVQTNCSLTQKQ